MSDTMTLNIEVETSEVVNGLKAEGYVVIATTAEAVEFIKKDNAASRMLFSEKENVRIFFAQDKFKSVPNKDLLEFLKKY